jgi:hypothetical protein
MFKKRANKEQNIIKINDELLENNNQNTKESNTKLSNHH